MDDSATGDDERFGIVIEADIAPEVLRRYWAGTIDTFGKSQFDESVASIAEALGIGVYDVTRLAKATGYGHRPRWRCVHCGGPWPLRTRTAQGPGKYRCGRCISAAAAAAEAQRVAAAATQARRAALVATGLRRDGEDRPVRVDIGQIAALPFGDVLALATWISHTGPDGILPAASEQPVSLFAAPGTPGHLFALGLVRLDPSSSPDAFDWVEETDHLPKTFDPTSARFHLPGAGPVADRTKLARNDLSDALRAPWPSHWVKGSVERAEACMVGEVLRRMSALLWEHYMDAPTTEQEKRLRTSAREALEAFTVGQCFTMTFNAVVSAAAAKRRKREMSAVAVTGFAVNKFATYLGRALDGDWDVFEYGRRADAPVSHETEMLAVDVLGLDPMTMSVPAVKQVATHMAGPGPLSR